MTDFNQAIVLGNLTRDPELRYTPNGQAVVSFSVATNRRWTNRETGQPQEAVEFHNIVAWGKLAEICNQILYKGRKALVVGRLQTRNWEGQDGVKRYTTEIVADHISATGAPKGAGEQALGTPPPAAEESSHKGIPPTPGAAKKDQGRNEKKEDKKDAKNTNKDEGINLDDIPF